MCTGSSNNGIEPDRSAKQQQSGLVQKWRGEPERVYWNGKDDDRPWKSEVPVNKLIHLEAKWPLRRPHLRFPQGYATRQTEFPAKLHAPILSKKHSHLLWLANIPICSMVLKYLSRFTIDITPFLWVNIPHMEHSGLLCNYMQLLHDAIDSFNHLKLSHDVKDGNYPLVILI